MEYAVGAALGLGACALGTSAGFERDRAFYPVMLIVIASYYDLFAVLAGGGRVLGVEAAISLVFVCLALIGFKTNLWLVVAGLLGHAGLDTVHGHVAPNAGVPAWWPMFCASLDAVAGLYLAQRLASRRIGARDPSSFGGRIRPHVEAEFVAAHAAERAGDSLTSFRHLERAHVLGQRSTAQHVRVHMRMLVWGLRHRKPYEVLGQIMRVAGAATKTWAGLIPHGNTGGATVSAFKSMTIPDDLADLIAGARS